MALIGIGLPLGDYCWFIMFVKFVILCKEFSVLFKIMLLVVYSTQGLPDGDC